MFLHTHKVISKLFNEYVDRLSELKSINLLGPSGLGKLFYIQEFIRQIQCDNYKPFSDINGSYWQKCDCRICRNIINDKACDVLILRGNEKIDEVRSKINQFVDTSPVEFKYKFLVVQNLHKFNNHELDVFLNFVEEPPKHIKIFTTASDLEQISDPIKSRIQSFELSYLLKEDLKLILTDNSELEAYLAILDKYDFKTINQLIFYSKYDFEGLFLKLFSKAESSYEVDMEFTKFLDSVREQNEFQLDQIINFFLEFYLIRVYEFCDLNPDNIKIQYFKEYTQEKVVSVFSKSLFKYSDFLSQKYVNIRTQLFIFFNLIFTIKKIMEI